eukprot:g56122.t1
MQSSAAAATQAGNNNNNNNNNNNSKKASPLPSPDQANWLVLEENSRLSHSMMWSWLRSFYETKGIGAWTQNIVPTFVAANAFIANQYARVLLGFLRDVHHQHHASGQKHQCVTCAL